MQFHAQKLPALADFTRVMFRISGPSVSEDVAAFRAAGFTDRHVLEMIFALAVKTLSNYANHVFHTDVDDRISAYAWQPA
jgi:alkylhydroperoxidase family enzyme